MSASIASLMQARVQTVDIDASIAQVEAFLLAAGRSWVPVTDHSAQQDDGVLGVISATDLLKFHAEQRDTQAVHAWQLCTYRPLVVGPQTPLAEVAAEMVARHIHHVVVAEGGRVLGVVSSLDFVARFARNPTG